MKDEAMPLVSVIIPCFNYGPYLIEALDSVLQSTFQDFEIIVVDDGSNDPITIDVLNSLNKPRTRVIHQTNKGPAAARNRAIREAKGKYIFPLDADDRIHPTLLEKGYWILESRPEVGVVTSWMQTFGNRREVLELEPYNFHNLLFNNMVVGNSLYRKLAWEQVGGYDENPNIGFEDWDFWIKLGDKGWKFYQIREPLFYYRQHGETRLIQGQANLDKIIKVIRGNHVHLYNQKNLNLLKKNWKNNQLNLSLEYNWSLRADSYSMKPVDTKKIKVLIITSWMEVGGAERLTADLARSLGNDQVEFTLVTTLPSPKPRYDYTLELFKDVFYLPHYFEKTENQEALLLHIIESRKIQVILINNSELGYSILPKVKQIAPEVKSMALLHSYVPEYPWDFVRKSVELDKYIDRYMVSKKSLKKTMEFLFLINPEKIGVFVSGIDTSIFHPGDDHEVKQIKKDLQIPPEKDIVSFISRLDFDKNPIKCISIVKHLAEMDPDDQIRILIVGDGEKKQELLSEIANQNLQDKIIYLGYRNDINQILKITNVVISTSPSEGMPLIGLETMATGVPIVAYDVPGWQEIIRNQIDGLIIPRSSIEDEVFASKVKGLLANKGLLKKMGSRAAQRVMDYHRLDQFGKSIKDAFQQVLFSNPIRKQGGVVEKNWITITIISDNQACYLKRSIESVFSQTYSNWKLIVIDNASRDNTSEITKPYLSDMRMTFIKNEQKLGYGKILNMALEITETPYFLYLDAAHWLESDVIEYFLMKAQMLPEDVAGLGGNISVWEKNGDNPQTINGYPFSEKLQLILANHSLWPRLFRTSAIREVFGWPIEGTNERRYLEELGMLIQLTKHYRFYWLNRVLINYQLQNDSTIKDLWKLDDLMEKNISEGFKRWFTDFDPFITTIGDSGKYLVGVIPKASEFGWKQVKPPSLELSNPGASLKKIHGNNQRHTRRNAQLEAKRKIQRKKVLRQARMNAMMQRNKAVRQMQRNKAVRQMQRTNAVRQMQRNNAVRQMQRNNAVRQMQRTNAVRQMQRTNAVRQMQRTNEIRQMQRRTAVRQMQRRTAVRQIQKPAAVRQMQKPAAVRQMQKPAAVRQMQKPAAVRQIRKPTSVRQIRRPAAVHQVKRSTALHQSK